MPFNFIATTAMKSVKLLSGNTFYYESSSSEQIAFGFIVSPDDTFVGGFLGKEAERKYAVFSKLKGVTLSNSNYDLRKLKLEVFAEKLGAASRSFVKYFFTEVRDMRDCDGTSSSAQSCDDRGRYYKTVGLDEAFKTYKSFLLGLFIANHVSIFGIQNFRMTFFRGKDNPSKDDNLERDEIFMKNVYDTCGFKAPAAYVKALCGE